MAGIFTRHPPLAGINASGADSLVEHLGITITEQGEDSQTRGMLTAMTLVAALPAAANITLLAERFGADGARVARVIMVSTVVSFVTFTLAARLLT